MRHPGQPVFRRQHPIGPYVLDFFCAKARLAIEIDGISHDMDSRPRRDAQRDAWLKEQGVTVMRVSASELMRTFEHTLDAVFQLATELGASDAPSTALAGGPPPPLRGGGS